MMCNTTSEFNLAMGNEALKDNTTGSYNIALGYASMTNNTTGQYNVAVGFETLLCNTTGQYNVAVGFSALCENTIGYQNVAIGYQALLNNTSGFKNVAIGHGALGNAVGNSNQLTAVGYLAGSNFGSSSAGANAVFIGNEAGRDVTAGNVLIVGNAAACNTTGGSWSTILGPFAAQTYTGQKTTVVGAQAGNSLAAGCCNTLIGQSAGSAVTSGSCNTFVGSGAGSNIVGGSNNIVIGRGATASSASVAHEITLGDSSNNVFRIPGLNIHANSTGLGIGTSSPGAKLHVADNIKGDGNFSLGTLPTGASSSSYRQAQIYNSFIADSGGTNSAFQLLQNAYVGSGNNNYATVGSGASHSNRIMMTTGKISFSRAYPVTADSQITYTESMRIENTGQLHVLRSGGSTFFDTSHKIVGELPNNTYAFLATQNMSATAGPHYFAKLFSNGTSLIGSITASNTATAFNTSSDYRLKENVSYDFDATTRLKQLKPARFNFISDTDTTVDGFLAHEVSSVVPEAITGTKDAVQVWKEYEELPEGVSVGDNKLDENGNTIPEYQGIDQAKLVPVLTKALQEAITKIEELEARINTLEGN